MILTRYFLTAEFDEYENLFIKYGAREKKFRKKENLPTISGSDGSHHISYYIKKGIAKLILIDENGDENIMLFMGSGSLYPIHVVQDMFSLENGFLYIAAVTELEVLAFPAEKVEEMIRDGNHDFAIDCLKHYNILVNNLLTRGLLNTYNSSMQFVCSVMYLFLYYNASADNMISLTQDDIARITSLSRMQVARIIARLKAEKIAETGRNQIKILDVPALKDYCSYVVNDTE